MSTRTINPGHVMVGKGNDILKIEAIGAGAVICMYDSENKIGGVAYGIFPKQLVDEYPASFSWDMGVGALLDELLEELEKAGAKKENLQAKLIGGARIFFFGPDVNYQDFGRQNVGEAKQWLHSHDILLTAEETGDSCGRSVQFSLEDGTVEVSFVSQYKFSI